MKGRLDELGTVYVIEAPHATKIGITALGIDVRLSDLKRATGMPELRVACTWDTATARRVERAAHWLLRHHRTVGEWFAVPAAAAVTAVETVLACGIPWGAEMSPADTLSLILRLHHGLTEPGREAIVA
jgi:Meiotically Up-regulated Gene 113 (MUG113) protein